MCDVDVYRDCIYPECISSFHHLVVFWCTPHPPPPHWDWMSCLEMNLNDISLFICVCVWIFVHANTSLLFPFSKLIKRVQEVCRCHSDGDLGVCVCVCARPLCVHRLCLCVSKAGKGSPLIIPLFPPSRLSFHLYVPFFAFSVLCSLPFSSLSCPISGTFPPACLALPPFLQLPDPLQS